MVQIIDDPGRNFGARFGAGIGRGLAEQIPKEAERYRLAQGLKQFEQDVASGNLSPMQQLARLSAIPGITPQMIQSFGELGKQQARRNAFRERSRGGEKEDLYQGNKPPTENIANVKFETGKGKPGQQPSRLGPETESPSYKAEAEPGIPWTQEKYDRAVEEELAKDDTVTPEEAQQRASLREQRELARPEAYQSRDKYLRQREADIEKELASQLETTLQKEGKEVYQDIPGDTLLDLKENVRREMNTNPRANIKNVVRDEVKKAHDFVRSKNNLQVLANRPLIDRVLPGKKENTLKSLMQIQKSYADMGKELDLYNTLQASGTAENKGFGASPGGAALIAFPRSEAVNNYLKGVKGPTSLDPDQIARHSRKLAIDIGKRIQDKDSIQAIARQLRDSNIYFDENAFFQQLTEDQDQIGLTKHQKQDLEKGVSDIFPNWGDVALFPTFGKSVAND